MLIKIFTAVAILVPLAGGVGAQESDYGVSLPATFSASAMRSQRLQLSDPGAAGQSGGFRAVFYPSLKLGRHWFAYASIQVRSTPYFYYDAFVEPTPDVYSNVFQAFVGYSAHPGPVALVVKAGRLSTAFGSFASRYDDLENPLLDQPLAYITEIPLRSDQWACGTRDQLQQRYGSVANACGGSPGRGEGLTPATLYGLPGVQTEILVRRFDARVQLTSGSPANPRGWTVAVPYRQWTAGAGYTFSHRLRIGVSGFSGPYLDRSLASLLPVGRTIRDFPASAVAVDGRWARGRWSLNGEWQRYRFASPGFMEAPSVRAWYLESKTTLTPRWFVAARVGRLTPGHVTDTGGVTARRFAPELGSYEFGGGYWLSRSIMVKASYDFLRAEGSPGSRLDIYGVQLVVSLHAPQWAFR